MPDTDQLPTIRQLISNWLGVQLPVVALPQTLKNIDKAVGKIILAIGQNFEIRIKGNAAKVKEANKIDLEGLYRTEEEKRKLENRVAVTRAALEDIEVNPPAVDTQMEIDDDWLNLFVRLAEDKSSKELQQLFGKILAGKIGNPTFFGLRTVLLMSTISREEADTISRLLSYAIYGSVIPFTDKAANEPTVDDRVLLEDMGIAGNPAKSSGLRMIYNVAPMQSRLLTASDRGILIENKTPKTVQIAIPGQLLTTAGRELAPIANSPPTDVEFLKNVAKTIFTNLQTEHSAELKEKFIGIHVVNYLAVTRSQIRIEQIIYTQE